MLVSSYNAGKKEKLMIFKVKALKQFRPNKIILLYCFSKKTRSEWKTCRNGTNGFWLPCRKIRRGDF